MTDDKKPQKRVFVYDGREFPDPDPTLTVDQVRQSFTQFFPELANAETKETKRKSTDTPDEEEKVIEFKKRVGTKGIDLEIHQTAAPNFADLIKEYPVAIKVTPSGQMDDGSYWRFYRSPAEAEQSMQEYNDFRTIETKLEEFVIELATELNLPEYQIWSAVHEASEGRQYA
jgi:PRTRC genetic system protein C